MAAKGRSGDVLIYTVDEFAERADRQRHLQGGGPGGTSSDMSERVTRLETHMEYVRADLGEIKEGLRGVTARLVEMPTKSDLNAWKLQWTALVVAAIALIVGGVIGGLAWIKPDPVPTPPPTPIIVQVPPQMPAATAGQTPP